MVRKGIERMEKQIIQLISVFIFIQQMDIGLLKNCNTVDVPAVNSAIGNIQRSLQKYVGFEGMESEFCDVIETLMDQAQTWCLNIEDLTREPKYILLIRLREMQWMLVSSLIILRLQFLNSWRLRAGVSRVGYQCTKGKSII